MKTTKLFATLCSMALTVAPLCAQAAEKVILVTGFTAADKTSTDSSWEAVKDLDGKHLGKIKVVALQLPVNVADATKLLHKYIKSNKPVMIITFGQGNGTDPIVVETTARNVTSKKADANSLTTANPPIYDKGPATLDALLPIDQIKDQLTTDKIPVQESDNPGVNTSNDIFYTLMFDPGSDQDKYVPRGLIFVPPVGAKITTKDNKVIVFDAPMLHKAAQDIVVAAGNSLP